MTPDELFMQRALELAQLGVGRVSPNPRVGCVITCDDKIIGEGWHRQWGGPHAEVNAINAVRDPALLSESTVYVNLEPCSHFGKTPPCADLLIRHRVKKVVIGSLDSNPLVAGRGVEKLKSAGVLVVTGVLEKECRALNIRFFTFMEKRRPYIILKWAQTADRFIARKNYESKWISDEWSRQWVHRWRSEEDAVLVGTRTAAHDHPLLTVRDWSGRNPTRVVLDRFLRLDEQLALFDGSEQTLCYNVLKNENRPNLSLIRISEENFMKDLVHDLYLRNVQSVIVEGGAQTLQLFLDAGYWDEARVFTASRTFGEGIPAPVIHARHVTMQRLESDTLAYYWPA